jgi:transcriptional regulator with XRE-family HTH domain
MKNQDDFYVALGLLIKKSRLNSGLTQEELADKLGLSRTSITNIEKGKQRILAHTVAELAAKLNVSAANLLPQANATITSASSVVAGGTRRKEREFLESVLARANR